MKPYLGNFAGRRLQSHWNDLKLTGCFACHSAVSVDYAAPQVTRFSEVPAEDGQSRSCQRRSMNSRFSFGSSASSDSNASEQGKLSRGTARVDLCVHHMKLLFSEHSVSAQDWQTRTLVTCNLTRSHCLRYCLFVSPDRITSIQQISERRTS